MVMTPTAPVPEFELRRSFYKIDDRVQSVLAATWPLIAPNVAPAINDVIDGILTLPHIGPLIRPHTDLIKRLEAAHFQALLGGKLDQAYAEFVPPYGGAGDGDRVRRAHPQQRRELRAQGRDRRAGAQASLLDRAVSPSAARWCRRSSASMSPTR